MFAEKEVLCLRVSIIFRVVRNPVITEQEAIYDTLCAQSVQGVYRHTINKKTGEVSHVSKFTSSNGEWTTKHIQCGGRMNQ